MKSISELQDLVEDQMNAPNVERFIDIIYKLSELDTKYYAKNSDLRQAALLKILQYRDYPNEEVQDALETLRFTLVESIDHEDWVSNYRDCVFCETVQNEGLIYECIETECDANSICRSILDSEKSSEEETFET